MSQATSFEQLAATSVFARQFATLIGAGVSLARALGILEQAAPGPELAAVVANLQRRVGDGQTLCAAMREHPDWFDRVAINTVRAGEVGGVLDQTLGDWAGLLDRELDIRERCKLLRLVTGSEAADLPPAPPREGADEQANACLFCHNLGVMLGSGVPLPLALETAAEFLDGRPREVVAGASEGASLASALAEDFPPVVGQLVAVGEETGTLDLMALRAAEFLRLGIERDLRIAMEAWLAPAGPGP